MKTTAEERTQAIVAWSNPLELDLTQVDELPPLNTWPTIRTAAVWCKNKLDIELPRIRVKDTKCSRYKGQSHRVIIAADFTVNPLSCFANIVHEMSHAADETRCYNDSHTVRQRHYETWLLGLNGIAPVYDGVYAKYLIDIETGEWIEHCPIGRKIHERIQL